MTGADERMKTDKLWQAANDLDKLVTRTRAIALLCDEGQLRPRDYNVDTLLVILLQTQALTEKILGTVGTSEAEGRLRLKDRAWTDARYGEQAKRDAVDEQ